MNTRILVAVIWTLAILVAVCLPPDGVPPTDVRFADKAVHLGMFAVLGALWLYALPERHHLPALLIGTAAFAVATELLQGILPWERTPEAADALANLLGLALGMAARLVIRRRARRLS